MPATDVFVFTLATTRSRARSGRENLSNHFVASQPVLFAALSAPRRESSHGLADEAQLPRQLECLTLRIAARVPGVLFTHVLDAAAARAYIANQHVDLLDRRAHVARACVDEHGRADAIDVRRRRERGDRAGLTERHELPLLKELA